MPINDEYDEYDESEEDSNGPKDLRRALNKANKERAEQAKQIEDLMKQLKSQSLANLMSDKKIPANIQRWMKRDEVEATPEAIDKWLAENGEDFGYKPEAQGDAPKEEEPVVQPKVEQKSVLTEEDINAYLRQQAVSQEPSVAPTLDPVKAAVDNVAANIDITTDPAVVARMLKEAGIPVESQMSF